MTFGRCPPGHAGVPSEGEIETEVCVNPPARCDDGIEVAGLVAFYSKTKHWPVTAAFRAGQYSLVEGTVADFHPMPYEGHNEECFTVEDQRFCYSDYVVTPGFHNTASHGGPIPAGIHVRIAYLGHRSSVCKSERTRSSLRLSQLSPSNPRSGNTRQKRKTIRCSRL